MNSGYILLRSNTGLSTPLAVLLGLVLLFVGCGKDEPSPSGGESKDIKLLTSPAEEVSTRSVTFKGAIEQFNNEKVLDHGFIFVRDYDPTAAPKEIELSLGPLAQAGPITYTYRPESPFDLEDVHAFCLYVKTDKGFYKGTYQQFEVDGLIVSQPSVLQAAPGDAVQLTGDFSVFHNGYKLLVYDDYRALALSYTVSEDKKSLTFHLPVSLRAVHGDVVGIVYEKFKPSYGQISKTLANVRILGKIDPPMKKQYYFGETLTLTGSAIPYYLDKDEGLEILIGDISVPYQREIRLADLEGLTGHRLRLGFKNGRDSVIFTDPIELHLPDPSNLAFNRYVIHPFSQFTASNYGFYTYFGVKGQYSLGQAPLEANSIGQTPTGFSVGDIPDGQYFFKATNQFYTLTSTKPIEVRKLVWTSIDKTSGHIGEDVVFKGNFIKDFEYEISFDGDQIGPVIAQDETLVLNLAPRYVGKKEIRIGYRSTDGTFVNAPKTVLLETYPFKLDRITPLKGRPGDVITVEGKGVGYTGHILVGDKVVYPLYYNHNKIAFPTPDLPSGKVRITLVIENQLYPADALFELL